MKNFNKKLTLFVTMATVAVSVQPAWDFNTLLAKVQTGANNAAQLTVSFSNNIATQAQVNLNSASQAALKFGNDSLNTVSIATKNATQSVLLCGKDLTSQAQASLVSASKAVTASAQTAVAFGSDVIVGAKNGNKKDIAVVAGVSAAVIVATVAAYYMFRSNPASVSTKGVVETREIGTQTDDESSK